MGLDGGVHLRSVGSNESAPERFSVPAWFAGIVMDEVLSGTTHSVNTTDQTIGGAT